jgi:hypothetical protein
LPHLGHKTPKIRGISLKIPQDSTWQRAFEALNHRHWGVLARFVGTPLRVPEKQVIEPRPFRQPGGTF